MLNPSVIDLLTGVAEALAADVADALPAGPARDQLTAAVAIIRRVARALPLMTPYLLEDIADLSATLELLDAGESEAAPEPLPQRVAPLDELIRTDLALRARLAEVADAADLGSEADGHLRAALQRLADREATLRLSPWGR